MAQTRPPESKPASEVDNAETSSEVRGLRRWFRHTARKHSKAKRAENSAAKAAADALRPILRDELKFG